MSPLSPLSPVGPIGPKALINSTAELIPLARVWASLLATCCAVLLAKVCASSCETVDVADAVAVDVTVCGGLVEVLELPLAVAVAEKISGIL
jgi:hypothetical protein